MAVKADTSEEFNRKRNNRSLPDDGNTALNSGKVKKILIWVENLSVPFDRRVWLEAQALDLYQRAADRAETEANKEALVQIANEERAHLEQLGKLFENL